MPRARDFPQHRRAPADPRDDPPHHQHADRRSDRHDERAISRASRRESLDAVRNAPPLVAHSDEVAAQAAALKRFLFKNLYRHYRVMRMANKAKRVVTGLFDAFTEDPRLLPPAYQARGPVTEESANDAPRRPRQLAGASDRALHRGHDRSLCIEGVSTPVCHRQQLESRVSSAEVARKETHR